MEQDKWLGWLFEALGINPQDIPEESVKVGPLDVRIVPPELPGRPTLQGTSLAELAEDHPVLSAEVEPPPALISRNPSTRPERMSPTAIHLYQACPACYKAQYVLGAPKKRIAATTGQEVVPATVRGTVVHKALEMELVDGGAMESLCREHGISDGTAVAELVGEAGRAVKSFAASELGRKVSAANKIMREQQFSFMLHGVRIHGFIDLLFEDAGGTWHVVDHKTNRVEEDNYSDRMHGNYALQMALYQLAVANATGTSPEEVEATIFCTAIGREVRMTADAAALAAIKDEVQRVIDAIERGEFKAPLADERKEHVCIGCPFRNVAQCGEERWKYNPAKRESESEQCNYDVPMEGEIDHTLY